MLFIKGILYWILLAVLLAVLNYFKEKYLDREIKNKKL